MSDIINDGGPAFPHDLEMPYGLSTTRFHGMSLRDWLAGMALQGYLAMHADPKTLRPSAEDCVKQAYKMADAMLKEREK